MAEMALREFTDESGRTWCAWDTRPTSAQVRPEFADGWLTFESGEEKRRLSPVPDGWDTLPIDHLCLLLRAADANGGGTR